jgi:ectoine hydroxylase-related dioxygenase (phytanoyl-CoA dioxygenase family)
MTSIQLSAEERAAGQLNPDTVSRAKRALDEDGFVILEDVVDLQHIGVLRDKMIEDLPHVLARSDTPFNFTRSNVQQDPPPVEPYLFRDVLLNDYVIQVTESVLGKGVQNAFYSGNMALPRTDQRQPTHADMGHLWPNMEHPTPAYALVVNLPLVDMDVSNGATELWPGSHRDTSIALQEGDIKVSAEKLEEWRKNAPPIQPSVRAGSVLIRDMRLWHGGTPNPSDQPRPMIAMIHWVGWWIHGGAMKFPASSKPFFEHPRLRTNAEFVEEDIPYLGHGEAYDFDAVASDARASS